jgi:hypothetical protein
MGGASKKHDTDPGKGLFEALDRLNQRQQEDHDGESEEG